MAIHDARDIGTEPFSLGMWKSKSQRVILRAEKPDIQQGVVGDGTKMATGYSHST